MSAPFTENAARRATFERIFENMVGFVDAFRDWPIAEGKDQHAHPVKSSTR